MQDSTLSSPPSSLTVESVKGKCQRQLAKALLKSTALNNNNFDLDENDPWPNVDVGNLIIDLDADIMSSTTTTTTKTKSPPAAPAAAASVDQSHTTAEDASMTASNATSVLEASDTYSDLSNSGSAPAAPDHQNNSTSAAAAAAAAAAADKDLKIKIKRTKAGTTKNPEGKLEIVQKNNEANGIETSESSGLTFSADAVVSAVTAAVAKQNGKSSKMKLVSNNSSSSSSSATNSSVVKKSHGKVGKSSNAGSSTSNGSPATTNGSKSSSRKNARESSAGPPSKRVKVDAAVCTEIATMTEPDSLGPMDPGSSVTLEGIVWHETENGVLVINVTWRGKTYVGTLLDSTKHVNQWAPPRFSDSPTSELENRSQKSRSSKRNRGTPTDSESRSKTLRSSKSKNRLGTSSGPVASASPAKDKRKGRSGGTDSDADRDERSNKRQRTSSRNTPDENDEDSEKESKDKDLDDAKDKKDDKDEDHVMTPKDKEDEKYVPPPPLPYSVQCPKPGCNKKYRHHNGLTYHVSAAHKELLDEQGNIRDRTEIEKMEEKAKQRIRKEEKNGLSENQSESTNSGPSSKNSTPGPAEVPSGAAVSAAPGAAPVAVAPQESSAATKVATTIPNVPLVKSEASSEDKKMPLNLGQIPTQPNFTQLPGPPPNAKPIPVSAIEGVVSRPPPSLLNGPSVPSAMPVAPPPGLPVNTSAVSINLSSLPLSAAAPAAKPGAPSSSSNSSAKPAIRPLINARPIVPATAPLPTGALGQAAMNLKPIQPRPAIMADPTPNYALDDLRKKKEPKKKKDNSPGTSPPRMLNGSSSHSPKSNGGPKFDPIDKDGAGTQQPVKSPAYSDISDDEPEKKKTDTKASTSSGSASSGLALPPAPGSFGSPFPYGPYLGPPSSVSPQLPQVPVSSVMASVAASSAMSTTNSKPALTSTVASNSLSSLGVSAAADYQKIMQAYGFPGFPAPGIGGVDPALHLNLLATDPTYKAKLEQQLQKEKALKEQQEKEKRTTPAPKEPAERLIRTPEDLRKKEAAITSSAAAALASLGLKSDLRFDPHKVEPKREASTPKSSNDEGAKPTMETRGPPPGTNAGYGYMHPALRPGFPGGYPFDLNPLLMAGVSSASGFPSNPFLGTPPGLRPPFGPGGAGAADLIRAQLPPPGMSPEEICRAVAAGGGNSKMLEMLQSTIYGNHKIHELQERAMKSPSSAGGKASPKTQSPGPRKEKTPSPAPTVSSALLPAVSSSSRSPPPLRHVHTHTHTHFGMPFGLPVMQPPNTAPGAHNPLAGYPNSLLNPPMSKPSSIFPPK